MKTFSLGMPFATAKFKKDDHVFYKGQKLIVHQHRPTSANRITVVNKLGAKSQISQLKARLLSKAESSIVDAYEAL